MGGTTDRQRGFPKPYLIEPDGEGAFRLVVRQGRYNSQNYPLVTSTVLEERFKTTSAARAFAASEYGAAAGDFALPPRTRK